MSKEITVDIGDLCTHCGRDTSFGSVDHNGEQLLLFVNRIPSGADGKLMLSNIESEIDGVDVTVDGYLCIDCQSLVATLEDICPECEHLLQGADECPTCSASDHLGDGEVSDALMILT